MAYIRLVNEMDQFHWSKFVDSTTNNSEEFAWHHAFCWQWRDIIAQTFGHTPYYLIALDEQNQCIGVLPLFLVKSPLFGIALISVPYLNAGGVIAIDDETASALIHAAAELKEEFGAKYLELRNRTTLSLTDHSLQKRSHKVASILNLPSDPDQLFSSFPAKLRSQIKRPSKNDMTVHSVTGDEDFRSGLQAFYKVFSTNMRDLGTPVYPLQLFENSCKLFANKCRITWVTKAGEAVAAAITIQHRESTEVPWASSLRKFNSFSPNMLLYWEVIRLACLDGSKNFDFGRSSKDSSTLRFKSQWGSIAKELNWYYLAEPAMVPDVNPSNPRYRAMVACWQKLPLAFANKLGPWLTRGIP